MASYERFEDLPVWQTSAKLYDLVDEWLAAAPPRVSRSFRDQLERATLSVSNNIAEGFERGTTNELLAFLYIARGSAGEVRSMLTLLGRRSWLTDEAKAHLGATKTLAESSSRQLRAWAESLQNSNLTGTRHLNDKARANYEKIKSREAGAIAFQKLLDEHLPPDNPSRKAKS